MSSRFRLRISSKRVWCLMLLAATPFVPAFGQSNDKLKALADEYWQAWLARHPQRATDIGVYDHNHRLFDPGAEATTEWTNKLNRLKRKAARLPRHNLNDADKLTHDLLRRTIDDASMRAQLPLSLMPFDPIDGLHLRFPLILVAQPFRNRADFDHYIARLHAFPEQVLAIIANARRGLSIGFVAPRHIAKRAVPQLQEHIQTDATQSEFYAPLDKLENIPEDQREEVRQAIVDAIEKDVVPAYLALLGFLQDEYLPKARDTVGLSELPNGDKMYAALVYLNTTVRIKPDEVHEIGLAEVERIRHEMEKVRKQVEFEGDLDAFLEHMRTTPAQRFNSGEEIVASATEFLEGAQKQMPKLFGELPEADCVVRPIESYRAASSPVAFYNPTPEDGSRPGYFYVNLYAPKERLRFTMEALTYHEALPGHHLQIALDQENEALPRFRRYGSFTAYVEGWALYAEKLGYEIGGYEDLNQRFGQLTFEMWRACRLVVDTGMHAKGWSRDKAIDFMSRNTSLAPLDIEAEIDRYITWPGQALGYKIGELRILKLREDAEQALGENFDVRAFHDYLLSGGAMPIDVLEKRVRAWIAEQKTATN